MNRLQKKRLTTVCVVSIAVMIATSLILYALKQNINVFSTPTELLSSTQSYHARLGGLVKKGSVRHDKNGLGVHFIVTDMHNDLPVYYQGVLPDLFREGKGVVAEGKMKDKLFIATQVLAKHDENYMPIKVKQAIKETAT